jgi:hypothetical protein
LIVVYCNASFTWMLSNYRPSITCLCKSIYIITILFLISCHHFWCIWLEHKHIAISTLSPQIWPIYTYLYYDSNCNIFIYLRQEENIICNSKVMLMGGGSNLILSISQTRRIDATSHNHNTIFVFTGIYPKVNWVGRSVPPPPVSRRGEDIITNFVSFGEKSLDNQKIGETYIMQIAI